MEYDVPKRLGSESCVRLPGVAGFPQRVFSRSSALLCLTSVRVLEDNRTGVNTETNKVCRASACPPDGRDPGNRVYGERNLWAGLPTMWQTHMLVCRRRGSPIESNHVVRRWQVENKGNSHGGYRLDQEHDTKLQGLPKGPSEHTRAGRSTFQSYRRAGA